MYWTEVRQTDVMGPRELIAAPAEQRT